MMTSSLVRAPVHVTNLRAKSLISCYITILQKEEYRDTEKKEGCPKRIKFDVDARGFDVDAGGFRKNSHKYLCA
jgi:hypothetical protein